MLTPDQFRDRIEAFLIQSDLSPTRFGIDAVRDPNFVADVRNGRVPSLTVASRVLAFIDDQSAPRNSSEAAA